MKLLEKLKNTFFEEEYVEVEENDKEEEKDVAKKIEKKEEPKVEAKKTEDVYKFDDNLEDTKELYDEPEDEEVEDNQVYSDREILKKEQSLEYFDDDDFVDEYYVEKEKVVEKEPKKVYGGSANSVYDSIINSEATNRPYSESAGRFHPTPIISPIYGVLDKNYRKEEVIDKKDRPSSYVSRRDVDLDSVRKKAYGDVSILDSKVEEEPVEENNEPLLYDMIDNEENEKPAVDKVTIADAEEYFEDLGLEYNVDYKDTSYEDATKNKTRSTRTEKHQEEGIEDISNIITDSDVLEEDEVDDNTNENLFDLVDSIYEDGDE